MTQKNDFLELKKNIVEGRFAKAKEILYQISDQTERTKLIGSVLCNLAAYGPDATAYAFNCYLILADENIEYHQTAMILLADIISYYEGVFPSSYFHASRVVALSDNNVDSLSSLFHTYGCPDTATTHEESREVALKILAHNPQNEFALQVLRDTDYLKDTLPNIQETVASLCKADLNMVVQKYLLKGRLLFAKNFLQAHFSTVEIESILFDVSNTKLNITPYTLAWDLLREHETANLHQVAAKIIHELGRKDRAHYHGPLSGTVSVEFFHTYRAAELAPENIEIKEKLLNFYKPEYESFYREETRKLVETILKVNPKCVEALRAQALLC